MNSDPVYVLDANVFIEAAKRYYAFDIAPRFWQALVDQASNGRVLSIDRVKGELEKGKDELKDWARGTFSQWFVSSADEDVIATYREIMQWAQRQSQFMDAAKEEFARVADGWLVAYAKARGCVVVTHEQPSRDARRRVLIPNVCQAFQVPFIDTFAMLRALGVRLG